jgi:hypothetical protein
MNLTADDPRLTDPSLGFLDLGQLVGKKEASDYEPTPNKSTGFNLNIRMSGLAISLIDGTPRELCCATVLDVELAVMRFIVDKNAMSKETRTRVQMQIGHVQIDNLVSE